MGAARDCECKGRGSIRGLRGFTVRWEFGRVWKEDKKWTDRGRRWVLLGGGKMRPEAVKLLYYGDIKGPNKDYPTSPEFYIN